MWVWPLLGAKQVWSLRGQTSLAVTGEAFFKENFCFAVLLRSVTFVPAFCDCS